MRAGAPARFTKFPYNREIIGKFLQNRRPMPKTVSLFNPLQANSRGDNNGNLPRPNRELNPRNRELDAISF